MSTSSLVRNSSVVEIDSIDKTRALPAIGDVLEWSGVSQYQADSLRSVLSARETRGVLHIRRADDRLLEVLDVDSGSVKPGLSLVLEEALNPIDWVRSSQWRARIVRSPEATHGAQFSENAGEGPNHSKAVQQASVTAPHYVALKLLYYDAREKGEDVDLDGFDFVNAPDLVKMASDEAACYAALEKCQGSIVPYCYGFYKFRLANGHSCIGQVVELVDGILPNKYAQSLRHGIDDEKIDAFLTNLYRTLIEFHKVSFVYRKELTQHMRLLFPLDPADPQFVVFDLERAVHVDDWESAWDEENWLAFDERLLEIFLTSCSLADAAKAWRASPKGAKLVRRWKTHPDDLSAEARVPNWCEVRTD